MGVKPASVVDIQLVFRAVRCPLAFLIFGFALAAPASTQGQSTTTTTISSITYAPNGIDLTLSYLNYSSIVTFTVNVIPQAPGNTQPVSGTVAISCNGTLLTGGGSIPVQNGTGTFVTTNLPVASDSFTATFTPASGSSFSASTTTQPVVEGVQPAIPKVTYTAVHVAYDGQPHAVPVTIGRPGLHPTIYYNGSTQYYPGDQSPDYYSTTPPTEANSYLLDISFSDYGYSGTTSVYPGALVIDHARGSVVLGNLTAKYDGNPHPVTFTVTPASEAGAVVVNYPNYELPPSAAGAYLVSAYINGQKSSYGAITNGTLIISTGGSSVWVVNQDSTVTHLSSTGGLVSTSGKANGTSTLGAVAVDGSGDVWSVANAANFLTEVSPTGALVGSYKGGGLSAPVAVAIDGLGFVWVANSNNSVSSFGCGSCYDYFHPGDAISPVSGFQPAGLNQPSAIAVDQTGSVWIANAGSSTVTRLLGLASPVVAPTVNGTIHASGGTRP